MIGIHEELLRRGGNQSGGLLMTAGLVAYFIEPVDSDGGLILLLSGCQINGNRATEQTLITDKTKS